jgi:hypothetical protein
MSKIPINFLIGFLLGCFLSMAYYDGLVAKEYKEKVLKSTDALKRSSMQMEKTNSDNSILLYYIDSLIKENEEMRKKISHDHFAL